MKVEIEIDTDGSTEVAVKGVAGPSCKSLTQDIERALGGTVADVKTPEFTQSETAERRQHQ